MRVLLVALAVLAAGCSSGSSCDELPDLTRQRDAARQDAARLSTAHDNGQATEAELDKAHDVMHELDRRVYDLAQSCD
jgi:hypothetical protein